MVLYELLTGERLFTGEGASETMAQVLAKQLDFARAPAKAQRLLRSCRGLGMVGTKSPAKE